jgi:FAD/FMN-containing dehydrogenase
MTTITSSDSLPPREYGTVPSWAIAGIRTRRLLGIPGLPSLASMTSAYLTSELDLVEAGDPAFDDAVMSRVFNLRRPSRRPAAVLRARSAEDVAAGVRLANERGWQVTVRSGGHSWAVWSIRDDALLIDLGALTDMSFDKASGIVTAGPAVRGGSDLDPFLAGRGRFFNGGHCPTVGIGGFLLQGGMGWNCRGWGWAAESVVAIDVVTADGEIVRADASDNTDLFWAARGSGPGFPGIVTAFHLATRRRFEQLRQTTYVYPRELATEVLTWFHTARHEVPDSVELVVVGITPPLPRELGYEGSVVVVDGVCFDDDPDAAEAALAILDTCPVADRALVARLCEPTEMAALRDDQIRANPEGHRYIVDNAYLAGDTEEVVSRLVPAFTNLPTEKAFTLWFDMGRTPERPLDGLAISLQTDLYFAAYVVNETEAEDDLTHDWINATMRNLEPVSVGCYLGDSDFTRRPQRFFSDEALTRLREIREVRDPRGVFPSYLLADGAELNRNPWAE